LQGAAAYTGGNGGAGYTLTSIDSNLTAANFATFTGMTVISSGGGGAGTKTDAGTAYSGIGGTGAGNGGAGNTGAQATSATSFGSGGGGGRWDTSKQGGAGYAGLVIVRYLA